MADQVKETGPQRFHKLKAKAKEMGINTDNLNLKQIEAAIAAKGEPGAKGPTGISTEEAISIEAKLRFEEETREKIRGERRLVTDRAAIIAESESLNIPIDLPADATELDLAKARRKLGIQKTEVKPSPETVAIEAGKRGYYIFTNREQDNASHTVNLGGKYIIHLIPDQVHVLSDFHIKRWRKCAVVPEYSRVPTGINISAGGNEGKLGERCQRTGGKPRFSFEFVGEATVDAAFGLVTDTKVLEELNITS